MKNYYEDLGISKGASPDEIKKAYRKMAQKYHPDKNSGNKEYEEKFKKASEAYEVLSDPQKRSQYDQFGSTASAGGMGGGFGGTQGFDAQDFDFGGIGDIFETFFGGGFSGGGARQKSQSKRGADLEAHVSITFEQSVTGITKELKVTKHEACERCKTLGGSGKKICSDCGGTGVVTKAQRTPLGTMRIQQACSTCGGTGHSFESVCERCHGEGRIRESSTIKVKIPSGINNNSTIRLSGKGEAGIRGGSHGDLYIHVSISPSKEFVRKDEDIYTENNIHVLQAILGDEIDVKTIYGSIKLRIPAGTQSEKMFRLKGYGMPFPNSPERKGNHYVKIKIETPEKLSRKEKELYGELVSEAGLNIKPDDKGFFESLWG